MKIYSQSLSKQFQFCTCYLWRNWKTSIKRHPSAIFDDV